MLLLTIEIIGRLAVVLLISYGLYKTAKDCIQSELEERFDEHVDELVEMLRRKD